MLQFAKEWERVWEDVRCDHVSVWKILTRASGRIATYSCMAPAEEQRRNYGDLGQIQKHADFDEKRAEEAEAWVARFIQDGCGNGPGAHPGYTEKQVADAFRRTNECAAGVDGLTKKVVEPALPAMLTSITALFSFLRIHGFSLDQ